MADLKPVGRTSERTGSSGSPSSSGSSSSSSSGGVSIGGLTSVGGGSGSSDEGKTDAEIRAAEDKGTPYRFNPSSMGNTRILWADARTVPEEEKTGPRQARYGGYGVTSFEKPAGAWPERAIPMSSELFPPSVLAVQKGNEMVTEAMTYLESDSSLASKVNQIWSTTHDILQTPELITFTQYYWERMNEVGDPFLTRMQYGVTEEMVTALGEKYPAEYAENPSESPEEMPNVIVFNSEHKNKFSAGEMNTINGILLSLPIREDAGWIQDDTLKAAQRGNVGAVVSDIVSWPIRAQKQNPREQLAAEATIWLRDRELNTDEDRRDFYVWLWRSAEQKMSEAEGRESHLGIAGAGLDAPKQAVTSMANDITVDLYAAPGEELDMAHISLGQNVAMWAGMSPTIEDPGLFRGFLGDSLERLGETVDKAASLYAIPLTTMLWATGKRDTAAGIDVFSGFAEEFRQGSSYDLTSGGVDLASWLVLDPINYAAGMGFGMKAVKGIPRAANLSHGRALMQAVVPFYGANKTGVRFGITSRVTWAMFSNTWDEMVDTARASTRGSTLYAQMGKMDSVEEVLRKIEGFNGNEKLALVMHDAALTGDETRFWETLRVAGYGWNQKANPEAFAQLEGILNASDNKFNQAVQRALDAEELDIRQAMHPTMGTRTDDVNPFIFVDKNVGEPSLLGGADDIKYLLDSADADGVLMVPTDIAARWWDSEIDKASFLEKEAGRIDSLETGPYNQGSKGYGPGIAEGGIEEPITVGTYRKGKPEIYDGHHRIAIAERSGIEEVPIKSSGIEAHEWRKILDDLSPDEMARIRVVEAKRGDDVFVGEGHNIKRGSTATRGGVDPIMPGGLRASAYDAGVEARLFKNGPRMANSPIIGEYATKAGRVTIRGAGDTFAAFLGDEFVGMVEHATSAERQIAVIPKYRRKGVGSLLRSMAGEDPVKASSISGAAQKAFYDKAPTRFGVLTESTTVGDGQRKAIINATRNGWNEAEGYTPKMISWIAEHDPDLAARMQEAAGVLDIQNLQPSLFELRLADLTDDEIALIRRYVDDVADLDAIKLGDETFVGQRGGSKLFFGNDTGGTAKAEAVLGQAMAEQAHSYATKKLLTRRSHTATVVHTMPRKKLFAGATEHLPRWKRISTHNQVAQFHRRFKAGLRYAAPSSIDWGKPSQGGQDLRRFMKLLGVSQASIDEIMTDWWKAATPNDRRKIYVHALERVGDEVQMPKLKYDLLDYDRNSGLQSYVLRSDGREIGVGIDAEGYEHVVPLIKAHFGSDSQLPNINHLLREKKRYAAAKKLPKRLRNQRVGQYVTSTGEKREKLAVAYRNHITSKFGPKVSEGISDDDLMTIAYSDVMGFNGRSDGLGKANMVTEWGAKGYGAFHYIFTVGQLAFRPLAWMSRVGLEEHARGWMMGLPTLIRYPAQYAFSFYDAHWVRKMPKTVLAQRSAATKAGRIIFAADADMVAALTKADEILPGFSAKAKKAGINLADSSHLQAEFSHELGKALTGGKEFVNINSRGNIAKRVMLRGRQMQVQGKRLKQTYGIVKKEFNFLDDAPEIANKSNVWLFSDEMESSISALDWSRFMRKKAIPAYAHSYSKKLSQILNDPAGIAALKRMLAAGTGQGNDTFRMQGFINSQTWHDVRENVKQVARQRGGVNLTSEEALAEFYLDTIMRDEMIGSMLRPLWTGADGTVDSPEKFRIISEILNGKEFEVNVNGTAHTLGVDRASLAANKQAYIDMFYDQNNAGNFSFPTVTGYFDPLYANHKGSNPFRRFTNWALQTFGEDVSQTFHRQPAYLAERRRWNGILTRMGWNATDADAYAHQKAFEMVNYTFFNNQHTGAIIQRMNKAIPFFSAWAEVISTWAWKIPSQNYLPLGYARMFHRMDVVMQSFVKMGLVEIGEDGQWYANLSEAPDIDSPAGAGLSRAVHGMVSAPITVIEQMANTARWIGSGFDEEEFQPVDMSAWAKDNYQIAIGSPVRINDHGIMGVNQFQFGLGPLLNFAASDLMKRLPWAGDTSLINGETLADVFEQMPEDMGQAQVMQINKLAIEDQLGKAAFDQMMSGDIDAATVNVEGINFQVPESSWMDNMIDDMFFPFGHVDTLAGTVREIVPSGISYMLRGLGVFANDDSPVEGIINIVTDQMGEYQISSEINKQLIHLEASEGLVTRAGEMSMELQSIARAGGYDTIDEYVAAAKITSEESERIAVLTEDLELLNAQIMKRATDNAGLSLFARGLMGFFAPASPRMNFEEQKATANWWVAREVAEAAELRGSINYAEAIGEIEVDDFNDFQRFVGSVGAWAQDDTGDYAKQWFLNTYPSLAAWTQGTTYWGPAGPPPSVRNLDAVFEQIEDGTRSPYPPDVLMQRIMRSNVSASFETKLIGRYGNDPQAQFQGIIANFGEYQEMREEYRLQMAGLDMWDAELNDGAYADWRDRNEEDDLTLYDRLENELFIIQDAMDEILAMGDIVGLDPEDMDQMRGSMSRIARGYRDALSEALGDIEADDAFRNPREELIAEYFLQVVGPYYEGRTDIYDGLDEAETKEERSLVFETARDYENQHYLSEQYMIIDGESIRVPTEVERSWSLRSDEEKERQVLIWTGNKPEWLSIFAAEQIANTVENAAQYVPTTEKDMALYTVATKAKNKIIADARRDPMMYSTYERTQALAAIDEKLREQLKRAGRYSEVTWLDSWPIERLMRTNQLPPELEQIGRYYLGIKGQLEAMDKGPTSDAGRKRFLAMAAHLENVFYDRNPGSEEAMEELGINMFDESGRYAIYHRLYGSFLGELQ